MKIVIISDGKYGDRAVVNIKKEFPDTELVILPEYDPNEIIDEVELEDHTVQKIKLADLLINYHRHPDITYEICSFDIPIIQAINNGEGFLNQIRRELDAKIIMPTSMCQLAPNSETEVFNEFARTFGKPEYIIKMRAESNIIDEIQLVRRSPCGSTQESIKIIIGETINEAVLNQFALTVRNECREPMSYVINRTGVADNAMANHFFPLINALKELRPMLFEKGGQLYQYITRLERQYGF